MAFSFRFFDMLSAKEHMKSELFFYKKSPLPQFLLPSQSVSISISWLWCKWLSYRTMRAGDRNLGRNRKKTSFNLVRCDSQCTHTCVTQTWAFHLYYIVVVFIEICVSSTYGWIDMAEIKADIDWDTHTNTCPLVLIKHQHTDSTELFACCCYGHFFGWKSFTNFNQYHFCFIYVFSFCYSFSSFLLLFNAIAFLNTANCSCIIFTCRHIHTDTHTQMINPISILIEW